MNPTDPKSPQPIDQGGCPRCNSTEVFARGHRRGPDEYQCMSCGRKWDGPGMKVLTGEEARATRALWDGVYNVLSRKVIDAVDGDIIDEMSAEARLHESDQRGEFPALPDDLRVDLNLGPPAILGSDARDVPTPDGIPDDVAARWGSSTCRRGET